MKKLLAQIIAGILGLWLAKTFIPEITIKLYPDSNLFGVALTSQWQIFLVLGTILGLINFFIKPVIKTITLPLRILSLGIFSLAISMSTIWFLDIMFEEIDIPLWRPLLWTTLIIFVLNLVIQKFLIKRSE